MAIATSTAIALAIAAAAAATSAAGAIQQGKAAKQSANFQAAVQNRQAETQRQQAERERQIAEQQEGEFRRQQSALMARRRAIMGGAGVETSTGSPLLISEDFAAEVEFSALSLRNSGIANATRLQQQAGLTDAAASLTRLQGKNAQTASLFRAGSALLGGASQSARIGFGA